MKIEHPCYLSEVTMEPVTLVQRAGQTTARPVSLLHKCHSFIKPCDGETNPPTSKVFDGTPFKVMKTF